MVVVILVAELEFGCEYFFTLGCCSLIFREQQKKLSVLEMELAAARQEGFVPKRLPGNHGKHPTKKELLVVGVMTTFGRKKNQEAIRKAWMPTGTFFVVLVYFSKITAYWQSQLYSVEHLLLSAKAFQGRIKFCCLVSSFCDH